MRDYGKVHTSFWASPTMQNLDSDARLLALYLLTSPHSTMIGAFRLPDAYACEDLGWTSERFRNGLETLSGFVEYDSATKWVWIRKYLTFNRPENPNQWKAADKLAASIPSSVSFRESLIETVSERLSNSPISTPVSIPVSVLEGGVGETIGIPLDDGSEHPVTKADLGEFKVTYPLIDPKAEALKARMWSASNPDNRKTKRGVRKFLNGWMARAQATAQKEAPAPSRSRIDL